MSWNTAQLKLHIKVTVILQNKESKLFFFQNLSQKKKKPLNYVSFNLPSFWGPNQETSLAEQSIEQLESKWEKNIIFHHRNGQLKEESIIRGISNTFKFPYTVSTMKWIRPKDQSAIISDWSPRTHAQTEPFLVLKFRRGKKITTLSSDTVKCKHSVNSNTQISPKSRKFETKD